MPVSSKRMAPYHRTKGLIRAVHPDGIVTKPNTRTSDMQNANSGEGSGSLSRQSPLGGKKQVIDTGAADQVQIHNQMKRKLGSTNNTFTIKKTTRNT